MSTAKLSYHPSNGMHACRMARSLQTLMLLALLLDTLVPLPTAANDANVLEDKFIHYEPIKRGAVPCKKTTLSQFNCRPHRANPYHSSCSKLSRCRGDDKI
ncbi:Protein RALF-like 1 [Dendrobium catenatum]|uniref:Protein RALF-like 1 n=1 Tax=Dendrobium catenatum TaxID=906689 RepID=A0A2I0W7T4_9ASPA|nr:Protein RALF-like 1 [Dendrobium catenatum]